MSKKKVTDKQKKGYKEALRRHLVLLREQLTIMDGVFNQPANEMCARNNNIFDPVPINTPIFKARFTIMVYRWFDNHIDELVEKNFENSRLSFCKYDNYCLILDRIVYSLSRFINTFVVSDDFLTKHKLDKDYTTYLLDLFQFVLIAKGNDKQVDLISKFRSDREFIPIAIESDDYDIETVLNEIIKLAYTMVTFDTHIECTPSYSELRGIEEYQYPQLVEVLGQCVRYAKSYNPFYRLFMMSYPEIRTKNEKLGESYIIGLQALEFMKFIMDDGVITKFVSKLEKVKNNED